jgi:hypothetical protein
MRTGRNRPRVSREVKFSPKVQAGVFAAPHGGTFRGCGLTHVGPSKRRCEWLSCRCGSQGAVGRGSGFRIRLKNRWSAFLRKSAANSAIWSRGLSTSTRGWKCPIRENLCPGLGKISALSGRKEAAETSPS